VKRFDELSCVQRTHRWCALQRQADPPRRSGGGAWTLCSVWVNELYGMKEREPTCDDCRRLLCALEEEPGKENAPGMLGEGEEDCGTCGGSGGGSDVTLKCSFCGGSGRVFSESSGDRMPLKRRPKKVRRKA